MDGRAATRLAARKRRKYSRFAFNTKGAFGFGAGAAARLAGEMPFAHAPAVAIVYEGIYGRRRRGKGEIDRLEIARRPRQQGSGSEAAGDGIGAVAARTGFAGAARRHECVRVAD